MDSQETKDAKSSNRQHTTPNRGTEPSPSIGTVFLKTKKITCAVHMITDKIGDNEPVKKRIRELSVEILSELASIGQDRIYDGTRMGILAENKFKELSALLELAQELRMVSPMNAGIIIDEYRNVLNGLFAGPGFDLRGEIEAVSDYNRRLPGGIKDSFIMDKEYRTFNKTTTREQISNRGDLLQGHLVNRSGIKTDKNVAIDKQPNNEKKKNRQEQILSLFVRGKNYSIKDISVGFSDCSEKTIQRELNNLVVLGHLAREGEKRWSRYLLPA